jgi:hypothetical protein
MKRRRKRIVHGDEAYFRPGDIGISGVLPLDELLSLLYAGVIVVETDVRMDHAAADRSVLGLNKITRGAHHGHPLNLGILLEDGIEGREKGGIGVKDEAGNALVNSVLEVGDEHIAIAAGRYVASPLAVEQRAPMLEGISGSLIEGAGVVNEISYLVLRILSIVIIRVIVAYSVEVDAAIRVRVGVCFAGACRSFAAAVAGTAAIIGRSRTAVAGAAAVSGGIGAGIVSAASSKRKHQY